MSTNSTAREFLLVVEESALNTPVASPVIWPTADATAYFIRLDDGNAFSMYAKPVQQKIGYGGGLAKNSQIISDHYTCSGSLKTKLYGSQAAFLMGWATTEINSGQTEPWTTTELANDLASCTVYHGVQTSTGVFLKKAYTGVKVNSAKIEVSRQATVASLTLQLTGCAQTAFGTLSGDPTTLLPTPLETQMPLNPYTFAMLAGNLSIGGVSRTQFASLAISINNTLDGQWFENAGLSILNYHGREIMVEADLYLKLTPDDRSAYELGTSQAIEVVFENSVSGQNMTLNLEAQNVITDLPFDLPVGTAFMQKFQSRSTLDQTAGIDLAVSFA